MKLFVVIFILALGSMAKTDGGVASSIESLIGSMKESFSGLSAKRDLWYENYSAMTRLVHTDTQQLRELLLVSKMAIPLIWSLYANHVQGQKAYLHRLVDEEMALALPYDTEFQAPLFPYFHVESTLSMEELRDFQVEILRDGDVIFSLGVDFDERRVVLGESHEQNRIVLEGDDFPPFQASHPFTINVQIADDCAFASFWMAELDHANPIPLPKKHHWCTRDYQLASTFSIRLSQEDQEPEQSAEDDQNDLGDEELHAVKLLAFTVYDGVLVQ
ncbi:uncharacterized protein LOC122257055 [Penaeus japonicus]|uniref:uncharacterized protein LOC122257055 n=1 Tax=Penaeus japonicus TaxID=27405 RepID=UPI001C717210|nr:uncharacterized protein LOC122257055 [Penaeus japonicus]